MIAMTVVSAIVKNPLFRGGAIFCLLAAMAFSAQAFRADTRPALPDFDARQPGDAPDSAVRDNARAGLENQKPQTWVDFDPVTGSPKMIRSRIGFLESPGTIERNGAAALAVPVPSQDSNHVARAFLSKHRDLFGHGPELLDGSVVRRDSVSPKSGLRSVVWQQQVDGLDVFQAVFAAHTGRNGELVSVSSQFVSDPAAAADKGMAVAMLFTPRHVPGITAGEAVVAAAENLGESTTIPDVVDLDGGGAAGQETWRRFAASGLTGETLARLVWLPMNAGELRLCWHILLTPKARGELFQALVDARTGEVLLRQCLTVRLSEASYRVFTSDSPSPFSPGHATPSTAQPPVVARTMVTLSALDTNASPNGWINDGDNETQGNNVDAHLDRNGDDVPDLPRPAGSPSRVFDFPMDLTQAPSTYSAAATVQLFYWCNWMHDRLYQLGFDEASGNFQKDNFGRGGAGNDAVQADAQDGDYTDNAVFNVTPDGVAPRISMYLFTGPSPDRDPDLDAQVILHEYTHGLSYRLVGGGAGIAELQTWGMAEGWSDFYPMALLSEPWDDLGGTYAGAAYSSYQLYGFNQNYYYGLRRYPFSTNLSINPLTFKDIDPGKASAHAGIPVNPLLSDSAADEVHNVGEVWFMMLWEARVNLIAKHGFDTGNQLILQLVTDGMKLCPPDPTFVQGRDAILLADQNLTGGANQDALWQAFAKRGLGASAVAPASSTCAGVVEAYDTLDSLVITPGSGFVSGGPSGGPFAPTSCPFTFSNQGTNIVSWSGWAEVPWLSVAPSGLVPAGASVTVTVIVNSAAQTLSDGTYLGGIVFSNPASRMIFTRTCKLMVGPFEDNFDPDMNREQWSAIGGVPGYTVIATNYAGSASGGNSLWFGGAGTRSITTRPLDTSSGGLIRFYLRLGGGANEHWETVDLPGEGVVLECSTNNAESWTSLQTCDTEAYREWTVVSLVIPEPARSSSALFRWRQLSHSGAGFDQWALDDVFIDTRPKVPVIVTQPVGRIALAGQTAGFSVGAVGMGTLSYYWMKDGAEIAGQNGSSLVLGNVQAADAGGYSVIVSNAYGIAGSSNAVLTVLSSVADFYDSFDPQINAAQWSAFGSAVLATNYGGSVSGNNALWFGGSGSRYATTRALNTTDGGIIRFHLRLAGGSTSPWEAVDLPGDGVVLEFSADAGAHWTGAGTFDTPLYREWTPVTLPIPEAARGASTLFRWRQLSHSGADYDHWALDEVIIQTSPSAPVIVTPPSSQIVAEGSNVTFQVVAAGSAPLHCQWRWMGSDLDSENGVSLTLSNLQTYQAGEYDVVVTNPHGAVTSAVAVLTVFQPPYIVDQPASQTVAVDSDVSLYVSAFGTGPLEYQWLKNGAALLSEVNPGLWLSPVSTNSSGAYQVIVSGPYGAITSAVAQVTVMVSPSIVSPPAARIVAPGAVAAFGVTASGSAPLSYYWLKNGNAMADGGRVSGVNSANLSINSLQAGDAGQYSVIVSNAVGIATSSEAALIVSTVHHFRWDTIASPQTAMTPFTVTLTARNAANQVVTDFTGIVALSVVGGQGVVFSADFETGLQGFIIQNGVGSSNGLWHLSTGRGSDSGHSATSSLYYGRNEGALGGGNYDVGLKNGGAVVTPDLALPADADLVSLSFKYFMELEPVDLYDRALVEVSTNSGLTYVDVAVKNKSGGLTNSTAGQWLSSVVDLSGFKGRTVRIRFRFDTVDRVNNGSEGWYVDDIVVRAERSNGWIGLSPTNTDAFIDGVWTGTAEISSQATNVTLLADDGNGHTGLSNPFDVVSGSSGVVVSAAPVILTETMRVADGVACFTVTGQPGCRVEALRTGGSLTDWTVICCLTNASGMVGFSVPLDGDPSALYKIRQTPIIQ